MAKGRIKWFNAQKGYGFIARDDAPDLFIHINQWHDSGGVEPQQGQEVEFEVGEGRKGLEAKEVKTLSSNAPARPASAAATTSRPQTRPQNTTDRDAHPFLNPYNFVRYLEARPQGSILGDCPPPPHDRYVGLTGRITCEVEAVTPLFISDSHGTEIDPNSEKGHKIYRFFEYEGQPALPASGLRGMVRSVYEAVTNSCFGSFQKDEEAGRVDRLEYRVTSDPGLLPARVLKIESDKVILEILDCTVASPPVPCTDHPLTVKSGMASAYLPRVLRRGPNNTLIPFDTSGIVTDKYHDGERVAALVNTKRRVKTRRMRDGQEKRLYQWFEVVALAPADDYESLVAVSGQRRVFGYIHITGPNIENKHDERLFFRWDDQDPEPQKTYQPETIELGIAVVHEYNRMIGKYLERHGNKNGVQGLPFPSAFVQKGGGLKPNDLVYCFADDWQQAHLCPVSMPRLPYRFPRENLLPEHVATCHPETEEWGKLFLCPACRVFGWVHARPPKETPELLTAYAGRLRFSHGTLTEDQDLAALRLPDVPVAILGSPKPTTTQFYLLKKRGDGQLRPDGNVDYNNDEQARLRGRKFYRHHGKADPQEYTRATDAQHSGKDDQNRTVRGALDQGAKFTFTVDFENLAREELGALLWSLQLEPEMCHRLGFAKPLGFGSVRLTVIELAVVAPEERYGDSGIDNSGWADWLAKQSALIEDFRTALSQIYHRPFARLLNILDLKALLNPPPDLPVHYPRSTPEPDPEGKNFEWFMENKRRRLTLPLAEDESQDKVVEGLPLLKKGR